MISFDEVKRQANIKNHGFDFLGSARMRVMLMANCDCKRWVCGTTLWYLWCIPLVVMQTTLFRLERQKSMKNVSTGKTSPTKMVNAPDSPSTRVSDWEGAVLKQGGVMVGRARTRGPNREPLKEQVAVRYSPDVLAAFRATGAGWQTRMNDALRDWLRTHSPV